MGVCVSNPDGFARAPTAGTTASSHEGKKTSAQEDPIYPCNRSHSTTNESPRKEPSPRDAGLVLTQCTPPPLAQSAQPHRTSPHSSPCSTSLSVSTGGPFTEYNPAAWYNANSSPTQQQYSNTNNNGTNVKWEVGSGSGSDSEQSSPGTRPPPSGRQSNTHRKSASIGVLERISTERLSRQSMSISRTEDYEPQSKEVEAAAGSSRKSITARTRRLSSKLNDIPIRLERFLHREDEEAMPAYLARVFRAVDTEQSGSVTISTIAQSIFPDSEHDSILTTLRAADPANTDNITMDQFVKFFAHLSEDNCMGPEFDVEVGGGGGDMGITRNDSVHENSVTVDLVRERARSMSVKLLYDGTTEVLTPERKGPTGLRDIRIKSLAGQAERIKCIALSLDPRLYVVSHRHDSIAHIYTNQGREVRRLVGHGDSLLGIAFSPDRKYVATVSRDKLLVVWDYTVGLECHSVEHPGIVTAVAFAFDGRHVYTGCQDNLTRKISFPKGRLRATIPDLPNAENGVIVSVATQHTRNGLVVFSRSCDEHAYVAQGDTLSLCMQLNGHETLVWQTAFSSNDDYILTCCERKVIVWRTEDFSPVGDFDAASSSPSFARRPAASLNDACLWTTAIFGPLMYKHLVFAFNTQGEALVIDLETPEGAVVMDVRLQSSVYAASTSDHSNCIVCGDDLGNVYQLLMS